MKEEADMKEEIKNPFEITLESEREKKEDRRARILQLKLEKKFGEIRLLKDKIREMSALGFSMQSHINQIVMHMVMIDNTTSKMNDIRKKANKT